MNAAPVAKSHSVLKDGVVGTFRYLDASTEPSLYRNGKVYTKRDTDGSDAPLMGCNFVEKPLFVKNARLLPPTDRPTILSNGFEVIPKQLTGNVNFLNHEDVIRHYYPQCAEIVRAASGAAVVAPFDHNVRSALGQTSQKRVEGGQKVQGPAHVVHGDYTLTSSEQRVRDLTKPPSVNDTLRVVLGQNPLLNKEQVERCLKSGRWGIINVWRNIVDDPVMVNPLAMCDAATVGTEELVTFEIHYADRIGENYFAKHSDKHRWYYYPHLTKNEALLLKQWDSAGRLARTKGAMPDADAASGEPCTFSYHSAFTDPSTPADAPDRWSIEVRCVVLYDEPSKL